MTHGLIVDIGANGTWISPIYKHLKTLKFAYSKTIGDFECTMYDGYTLQHGELSSELGGNQISEFIVHSIENENENWKSSWQNVLKERIMIGDKTKLKFCEFVSSMNCKEEPKKKKDMQFKLPVGQVKHIVERINCIKGLLYWLDR